MNSSTLITDYFVPLHANSSILLVRVMIHILDKDFEISITKETIQERVKALADRLNKDYEGKSPVMVCILNGAFVFASDLVRCLTFQPDIQFAKYSSYDGMDTTGKVNEKIGRAHV